MTDPILKNADLKMKKTAEALVKELASIRTGRASSCISRAHQGRLSWRYDTAHPVGIHSSAGTKNHRHSPLGPLNCQ